MKARIAFSGGRGVLVTVLAFLAVVFAVYGAGTLIASSQPVATNPDRFLGCLPTGAKVDLSFADGFCHIDILSDRQFRQQLNAGKQIIAKYEEMKKEPVSGDQQLAMRELQTAANRLKSMWEIAFLGDDYVRLEPVLEMPFRERTPWIIVPEASIAMIKGGD